MTRPRSFRARLPWPAALALAMPSVAQAAAYAPGVNEPDPPTGELPSAATPAEPLRNDGRIRWELAPWRRSGLLSLDERWLKAEDGRRTLQSVLFADIDFESYVWEPWFVQMRAGLGLVAARDQGQGGDAGGSGAANGALTGRLGLSVFPASRFPFELRAEVGDTRSQGNALGSDYRSARVSLSQAWRPESGNDNLTLNLDHSRLQISNGDSDTLSTLNATAVRQLTEHSIELGANLSDNERSGGDSSRLSLLSARHSFHPASELQVESMATWNSSRLRASGSDFGSDVRQVSTFASWRPQEGQPLFVADAPLVLAGTARWVQADAGDGQAHNAVRGYNATLGASQELSRSWRMSLSAGLGRVDGPALHASTGNVSGSTTWTPAARQWGEWRWSPSVSANAGLIHASDTGSRRTLGAQGTHMLSRDIALGTGQGLSLSASQSVAAIRESMAGASSHALVHSASAYWQSSGDGRSQSFAGLSFSDSRTWSQGLGSFQLANLQWSQRLQFSRYASGSANITLQATRSASTQLDAFTGEMRSQSDGWQHFYSGSISYEQQRFLEIPRLRYTLLLAANSQQIERRAAGDIDAPREHVSGSIENRVDYAIGRLQARLSARAARVDGRTVAILQARLQRSF